MNLSSLVAKIGINQKFRDFNAHCWFACVVVILFGLWAAPVVLALAAWKEFWFDARYESPHQTFTDNAEDFAGYTTGALIGLLIVHYRLHS